MQVYLKEDRISRCHIFPINHPMSGRKVSKGTCTDTCTRACFPWAALHIYPWDIHTCAHNLWESIFISIGLNILPIRSFAIDQKVSFPWVPRHAQLSVSFPWTGMRNWIFLTLIRYVFLMCIFARILLHFMLCHVPQSRPHPYIHHFSLSSSSGFVHIYNYIPNQGRSETKPNVSHTMSCHARSSVSHIAPLPNRITFVTLRLRNEVQLGRIEEGRRRDDPLRFLYV